MKRVVLCALLALGCGRQLPASTLPVTFQRAVDPGGLRMAVIGGLAARGFRVDREAAGEIDASIQTRRYALRVRVRYSTMSYSIAYVSSDGMHERQQRGVVHVDRGYLRIVQAIGREIDSRAAYLPPPTLAAAPPTYGVSGALGAPPTAGGSGVPAPAPPAGAGGGLGAPGTGAQPASPPPQGYAPPPPLAAPAPVTPPTAIAPEEERPPSPEQDDRPQRTFWELAGPGIAVLAGSWIGNWGTSIAVQGGDVHLGLSFVPVLGPWLQLAELQWSAVPRWTGWFHPLMGLFQAAGLAMTVVGLVVKVRDGERPSARAALELELAATPGGVAVTGRFQ